ncbi:hypothetical protein BIS06_02455 [Halomonas sp. BBD48]|nr:hypothetical protein [Halomonas sp. BBD48]
MITTCAQRKRLAAPPGLCLGEEHPSESAARRFRYWRDKLHAAAQFETSPAHTLYQGAHWQQVRQLLEAYPAQLHVLSAGLGLLQGEDRVPGYQATFSPGHRDSVPGNSADWWRWLCRSRLPGQTGLRSLASLMHAAPNDSYLIVASPPYLQAVNEDLRDGLRGLADPRRCRIVTSRTKRDLALALAPHLISSRKAMQAWLGGGLTSLNIRLAHHLLETGELFQSTATPVTNGLHPADHQQVLSDASE